MLVTGVDLVAIARIERLLDRNAERFLARLCTAAEREARGPSPRAESIAACFAAKEAVAKALGVGLRPFAADGVDLHEIEVLHDARGRPFLRLSGQAARRAEALGVHEWSLSISHESGLAVALVVGAGNPDG